MRSALDRARRSPLLRLALVAALAATATAHVRLRYVQNGAPLFWATPQSVSVTIQEAGSDDISDDSHVAAIGNAVDSWNSAAGTTFRLVNTGVTSRTDWESDDLHLVTFDENNASGFFTGGSGTVAITPVSFFASGRIVDADVLFNGKDFRFTTSGQAGRFDVQDVMAHELGHVAGLDHSGVCGATMFPYVDSTVILHRSLSLDETSALAGIYPAGAFGAISGRVCRASDGSGVAGAHVAVRDDGGRLASAALADGAGNFTVRGLSPGTYTVVADPLDQPVSVANLGGGQTVATDFEAGVLATVEVSGTGTASIGTALVADDVSIRLGRATDRYPLRVVAGETSSLSIGGVGLTAGSSLVASDPHVALSNVIWFGSSVFVDVTVPSDATPGHFDLTVTSSSGARDVLVGGLEVTPPDPGVTGVSPGSGDPAGGDSVTVTGTGFRRGARVVIGDRVYVDGVAGGCTVLDGETIALQTAETVAGTHDVVVIDPTGVEGRANDAFHVSAPPVLHSAFPEVGSVAGGTVVRLAGENFVPGSVVTIGGIVQTQVFVASPTRIEVLTSPGALGGPYVLELTSPDGASAELAYSFVMEQDPVAGALSPRSGDHAGGDTVVLSGAGFEPGDQLVIGVDPSTGAGGVPVAAEFVDEGTLRFVTPPGSPGAKDVMVRDPETGQASVITAGFTYTGGDEVEGGGCAAVVVPGPPDWRRVIGGGGWFLLLLAFAAAWPRLAARRPVAAPVSALG